MAAVTRTNMAGWERTSVLPRMWKQRHRALGASPSHARSISSAAHLSAQVALGARQSSGTFQRSKHKVWELRVVMIQDL
jgi:hypothetical protein